MLIAMLCMATAADIGCAHEATARRVERPNIILIMSDDMGYSDIGCYGGEINTPVLDRLAESGLRFTQFYNTGRCCPTRASLLTGLYPHQTGIGWMVKNEGEPGYRGELNRNCVTIAEALKPIGYRSYAAGKWHVTRHTNPNNESEKQNWPLQRGFDRYYGIINGASSLWDPNSLVRGNQLITCVNDPNYRPKQPYHLTDAISDNAVKFIDEHESDEPFFLYVAYTAAHWPMHARPEDIAKYNGKYDAGYVAVRKKRLNKMKSIGLLDDTVRMSPTVGDWEKVQHIIDWETKCMEVYAAMVDQMDQGIGRIVEAVTEKEQLDNTLILYLQDNGGCAESAGRNTNPAKAKLRAERPTFPPIPADKRHYFDSVPKQTRDGWPIRRGHVMPGPADTYIGYGRNWANVSNTPFREYKHWVHEGGIATPLIAHWPNGIKDKSAFRSAPTHLIDLMATCLEVADTDYPANYQGQPITPIAGRSLVPVFQGESLEWDFLFWEHEGNRALRVGNWKLVAKGDRRDRQQPVEWELYDIAKDRIESQNLAKSLPEKVQQLSEIWQREAVRTKVYPCPQPEKKKQAKRTGK